MLDRAKYRVSVTQYGNDPLGVLPLASSHPERSTAHTAADLRITIAWIMTS